MHSRDRNNGSFNGGGLHSSTVLTVNALLDAVQDSLGEHDVRETKLVQKMR
jgi:hypothetical protein